MAENGKSECCGPGYASPAEAMKAPRETLLYTVALYIGTGIQKPDYLATIDADPESRTYSQVLSRLEMPVPAGPQSPPDAPTRPPAAEKRQRLCKHSNRGPEESEGIRPHDLRYSRDVDPASAS